jgi:glycine/D-amino acid oxidase-like deaminating enzyme
MKSKRVVIVGCGVVALCSAYPALKRGFSITLVERESPGGNNRSTGNAWMIVPSHFSPAENRVHGVIRISSVILGSIGILPCRGEIYPANLPFQPVQSGK